MKKLQVALIVLALGCGGSGSKKFSTPETDASADVERSFQFPRRDSDPAASEILGFADGGEKDVFGADASTDSWDGGEDAEVIGGLDSGLDAGFDASSDSGFDAGDPLASVCEPCDVLGRDPADCPEGFICGKWSVGNFCFAPAAEVGDEITRCQHVGLGMKALCIATFGISEPCFEETKFCGPASMQCSDWKNGT